MTRLQVIFLFLSLTLLLGAINHGANNGTLALRLPNDEPDSWEYQTMAVNLALHNRFPTMGIVGSENEYNLDDFNTEPKADFLKCRFKSLKPIINYSKPPAYPFILGTLYRITGVKMSSSFYLNFLFISGILTLLLALGNNLAGISGVSTALLSFSVFLLKGNFNLSDISPELMMSFLTVSLIFFLIKILSSSNIGYIALLGIISGLTLLTKGVLIILIVSIPVYFLTMFGISFKCLRLTLVWILALVLTIAPWSIKANSDLTANKHHLISWKNSLDGTFDQCSGSQQYPARLNTYDVNQIIVDHYKRYAEFEKKVFISNQFTFDELPAVHNELCVDGNWHVEWRYVDDLSYNTQYENLSGLNSVVQFYMDNPNMLLRIACAKIKLATQGSNLPFTLALGLITVLIVVQKISKSVSVNEILLAALLGIVVAFTSYCYSTCSTFMLAVCLMPFWKKSDSNLIPLPFLLLLINCLLITIVFYGSPRFISFGEPVFVFFSIYISIKFLMSNKYSMNKSKI